MNKIGIMILVTPESEHNITVYIDETQFRVERAVALMYPDEKTYATFSLSSIKSCVSYIKLDIRNIFRCLVDAREEKELKLGVFIEGPDYHLTAIDRSIVDRCSVLESEIRRQLNTKQELTTKDDEIMKLKLKLKKLVDKYVNFMVKESGKILKDLLTLNLDSYDYEKKLFKQ